MTAEIDLGIANLADAKVIGRGGFAVVYSATDIRFDRQVAVKVLDPMVDDADRRRFDTECRVMGRLSGHPNVVTVFDAGFLEDSRPYLVMEFIEGGSLAELQARRGQLPWSEVQDIAAAVADALAHAHDAGVLHRDVKPENILLDNGVTKLTDFGIASVLNRSTAGKSVGFSGTLLHTAPETFSSTRDERSDVYSLASTVHALLAGSPPFFRATDESVEPLMMRLVTEPAPPLPPSVAPQGVAGLIHRALSKDPAQRPQTAAEFAAALRSGATGEPTPAPAPAPTSNPSAAPPPPPPPAQRAAPVAGPAEPTNRDLTPTEPPPPFRPPGVGAVAAPSNVAAPPAPPPASPKAGRGRAGLVAAAALGLLVVGLIAGALLLSQSGDDPDGDDVTSATESTDTQVDADATTPDISVPDISPPDVTVPDLTSADGDECAFNTMEVDAPTSVEPATDSSGCRFFAGEITPSANELDFVVNLGEGQRAAVELDGSCSVSLVVVDGRGQAEDADLACASGVQQVVTASPVTAGEYRLRVRLAETSSASDFSLRVFDVTSTSDRVVPDFGQVTCERRVAAVLAAPVAAELRVDAAGCPAFVGQLSVPGELQEFAVALGAGERLALVASGSCSVSVAVIDPRGQVGDPQLLCASGVQRLVTATEVTAGLHTVRMSLAETNSDGDYEMRLHDVSAAVAGVEPEAMDTSCANPVVVTQQPRLAEVRLDPDDCVYYRAALAVPGERHEFVVDIASGEGLRVFATGGCNVSIVVIDARGVESEPRLLCASGFDDDVIPSPAAAGAFTLRLEMDGDATDDSYELRLAPAVLEN